MAEVPKVRNLGLPPLPAPPKPLSPPPPGAPPQATAGTPFPVPPAQDRGVSEEEFDREPEPEDQQREPELPEGFEDGKSNLTL
uniref:Uncharacterized protein n=1 Tax=Setaria viridis TaxID=4556 RepID=A0A4U6WCS3_SETVI|nr:hypothetical protein SEVIR_1G254200v2 [Setaria viridis]